MDYGVSLGRRFRALKLWFVIRSFGVDGLRALVGEHIRIARLIADEIVSDPELERMAEAHFSTIVFRHRPAGLSGSELDDHNAAVLQKLLGNREVYLSHTRVRGAYALRMAIGNIHTAESHARRALDLVKRAGTALV
jgi:aromatic-L-amino-acid decarboxylase